MSGCHLQRSPRCVCGEMARSTRRPGRASSSMTAPTSTRGSPPNAAAQRLRWCQAVANFGRRPPKARFAMVPAFVLALPDVKPGPKAVYASLCGNADKNGHCWRSLNRLAEEFGICRRQLQRWLNDLEKAGLLVRLFLEGRRRFLVVRDPEGRNWARTTSLKTVSARRAVAAPHGKAGAEARNAMRETPLSHPTDADVAKGVTPVSPKHDLQNKTSLTKEGARQEGGRRTGWSTPPGLRGLKRMGEAKANVVQGALHALADSLGWENVCSLTREELVAKLAANGKGLFSAVEAERILHPYIGDI